MGVGDEVHGLLCGACGQYHGAAVLLDDRPPAVQIGGAVVLGLVQNAGEPAWIALFSGLRNSLIRAIHPSHTTPDAKKHFDLKQIDIIIRVV